MVFFVFVFILQKNLQNENTRKARIQAGFGGEEYIVI